MALYPGIENNGLANGKAGLFAQDVVLPDLLLPLMCPYMIMVQVSNCEKIVSFLESHSLVKQVNYPGSRSSNPAAYEVQMRQVICVGCEMSSSLV